MRSRLVALVLAACAAAAWLYEVGEWLVRGVWVPQPISSWLIYSGVGVPATSSLQGRILRDHVLDFPAPLAVFGLAVLLWLLGDKVQEVTT